MQQNSELVCSHHKRSVCSVIVEKQVKNDERLLCCECMMNFDENIQIKGINIIQEKIETKIQENNSQKIQFLDQKIQDIEQLRESLNQLKSKLITTFDSILEDIKNWIDYLTKEQQTNNKYNLIYEIDKILNPDSHDKEFMYLIDGIIYQNNDTIKKILYKIKKSNDVFRELISKLKISFQKIKKIPETDISLTLMSNGIKQNQDCYAIAFNVTGQIMISGCGKDIKLWSFNNGELKEIQKLSFHKSTISCLLFSKLSDNFISGSYDSTIRIWKQFKGQEWKSLSTNEDSNRIFCLILSKNEKVLISGSEDHLINVWDVDFERNHLNLYQSLIKNTAYVTNLSFNESETFLVSCGKDKQIIVWMNTQNNKWEFKQIVIVNIQILTSKFIIIIQNQQWNLVLKFVSQKKINLYVQVKIKMDKIIFVFLNYRISSFKNNLTNKLNQYSIIKNIMNLYSQLCSIKQREQYYQDINSIYTYSLNNFIIHIEFLQNYNFSIIQFKDL